MTSRLRPKHLAAFRRAQDSNLPDLADVRRPSKVKNPAGGTTDDFTTVYTARPCHTQVRVLREIKEHDSGGKHQSAVRWVVRFAWDTVIELDDLLDVTETGTGTTFTLHVTSHISPQSYTTGYGVQCMLVE